MAAERVGQVLAHPGLPPRIGHGVEQGGGETPDQGGQKAAGQDGQERPRRQDRPTGKPHERGQQEGGNQGRCLGDGEGGRPPPGLVGCSG